jgi:hypothetical protein
VSPRRRRPRLTPEDAYEIEQLEAFADHERFCRESLKVRDKSGLEVPMDLGPAQRRLAATIERVRVEGRPFRGIFLKARQVWVSTGWSAQTFHRLPFTAGQRGLVVAHQKDAAANIFGYYAQFHNSYQPFRGLAPLPETVQFSQGAEGGYIKYANDSLISVATAKNVQTGRSFSYRFLHLSEFAFWPHPKVLMDGLMQCVPDDPDTMVLIESTANGMGNEFHKIWQRANDPADTDCEWTAIFFAWWEHPEYVRDLPCPAREFQDSLDNEEIGLIEKHAVKLEQLAWRRWKIANDLGGSVDSFHQEYPSSPDEAFLASGRPRFSMVHLARMPVRDGQRCDLEKIKQGHSERIVRVPNEAGAIEIFQLPKARHRYGTGVDTATGVDINAVAGRSMPGYEDPDYSVASTFDIDTGEQCAVARGRIQPGAFADLVILLLEFFNWSYCIPEVNAEGLAFLEALLRLGYPPGRIYHRHPTADEQFSSGQEHIHEKLGWKTTTVTRPQLISKLDTAIREMGIFLYHAQTVAECRSFVYKPNGRVEHADGSHDDTVFAAGLGVVGIESAPPDRRLSEVIGRKQGKPPAQAVRTYSGPSRRRGPAQTDRGKKVTW